MAPWVRMAGGTLVVHPGPWATRDMSLQRGLRARGRYTWRHTATSLPWTATCSAGNTMGA